MNTCAPGTSLVMWSVATGPAVEGSAVSSGAFVVVARRAGRDVDGARSGAGSEGGAAAGRGSFRGSGVGAGVAGIVLATEGSDRGRCHRTTPTVQTRSNPALMKSAPRVMRERNPTRNVD